jgi:hypothetical protein
MTGWSSWPSDFSGRPESMWIEERYRFNTDQNKPHGLTQKVLEYSSTTKHVLAKGVHKGFCGH